MAFSKDVLQIDLEKEADRIAKQLRETVTKVCRRRGAVVGMSGGIDSSCVSGLAVRAFGPKKVIGLHMPEGESADETLGLSTGLAKHLGIESFHEDISDVLRAFDCYGRRDDCIRKAIPEYGEGWKSKIVLPNVIDAGSYRIYKVVAQKPDGEMVEQRLPLDAYLGVVAASNFKQRTRKTIEYFYADRYNYAVLGTPNRLEYDQGFFVKGGDGLADVKLIGHLYKTQVYAMARHLGLPDEICLRQPTTDTYSLPQGQDEFYFSLPYDKMDLCLYGKNNGVPPVEVANALGLEASQVEWVYKDIDQKRTTTAHLHRKALLVGDVKEIVD